MCILVLLFIVGIAGCISSTETHLNDPALEKRVEMLEQQIKQLQHKIDDLQKLETISIQ
jgi:TolA-binding protein